MEKYQDFWQKLIPTYTKLQFAGSMGLLSMGMGWDYGKSDQWETDLLFGFVPQYSSSGVMITSTIKQNYMPWRIPLDNGFMLEPLSCGLYSNAVLFNDDFWEREPDRYPSGYYKFSTKVRFNIFLGQRINYQIKHKNRHLAKRVSFFYEISSNDLYLFNVFKNKYLKPKDYLSLSLGLKMQIF